MDKIISASCVLLVALLIMEALAVSSASGATSYAYNKAAYVAKQFVLGDETYKFDGITGSVTLTSAQGTVSVMNSVAMATPAPNIYTFKVSFKCSQAGYGNRAGKILAQVITPHTALVTVKDYKVISATIDGKWNMLTEKPI